MHAAAAQLAAPLSASLSSAPEAPAAASIYQGYQIIRRNGAVVAFEPS